MRFQNDGYLAHRIIAIAARARMVAKLLRAGKSKQEQKLAVGFVGFQGPVSHGAAQQLRVKARRGYYALACFEDTQNHREHTTLGMVRVLRIR